MEIINFDQLPAAVSNLTFEISEIKRLLLQKQTNPISEPEKLLTVQEAAKFLSLSVPTIYGLISKGELPVIKRSKRCYFSNIELLEYMKAGRKMTAKEISEAAKNQFNKLKRKR